MSTSSMATMKMIRTVESMACSFDDLGHLVACG
jgi:hypothetical protein